MRYVDVNSTAPAPPYTNWSTAAVTIQDAVDASVAGDEVVVTNGLYQTGGSVVSGAMTNRVAVTNAITIRSLNGPAVTVIQGYQVPGVTNGDGAVRCVYLGDGATLIGFTLTNGATTATWYLDEISGGGVWCESASALVSNCVLTGNSALYDGGGSYSGTLNGCTLTGNSAGNNGGGSGEGILARCTLVGNSAVMGGGASGGALDECTLTGNSALDGGGIANASATRCTITGNYASGGAGGASYANLTNCAICENSTAGDGGGAIGSVLNNCTLTGNSAGNGGGGAEQSTLNNCIIYFNRAAFDLNTSGGTLNYCCITPLPAAGTDNIDADPELAGLWHLTALSPCRGAGNPAYASGTDIDGEPWADPPSIGCDEYYSGAVTGALSVVVQAAYTNVAVGFAVDFTAGISGNVTASRWEFDDGTVVSNRPSATRTWLAAGSYPVVFRAYNDSNPGGVSATALVQVVTQPVHYVALNSSGPEAPYDSWAKAATNIQDAVDAATLPGALVLVSNGLYAVGGRVAIGALSNRVVVTKPLVVQSVKGPEATMIQGYQPPGNTNNDSAIRCVYLADGAVLAGFTLTNGGTAAPSFGSTDGLGAGIACGSLWAVVSNCVLTGNSSGGTGGGAYLGTFYDCTFAGNSAIEGGGAYLSRLNHCTLSNNVASSIMGSGGGGTFYAVLNNCTLTGNSAAGYGGAASYGTLNNCTLAGNSAWNGGAAYRSTLNNCALAGNSAPYGGGAMLATLNNCTLTANAAGVGGGAMSSTLNNCIAWYNGAGYGSNYSDSTLSFCCTTPLPEGGAGNIEADPELASASHLSWGSPCRGTGSAAYLSGTDIDGEPWAEPPSIGCDEPQAPGSAMGPLSVDIEAAYTNVAAGFRLELTANIAGRVTDSRWEFGDGTVISNRPYASYAWPGPEDYSLVLRAYNDSNPGGVSATVAVHVVSQPVHYVALGNTAPAAPYSSWATAATNIQDAVDAESVAGALVLVSNGVYGAGGRVVFGTMSNRLAVTIPAEVRSVSGPKVTTIEGTPSGENGNGEGAVRCAYLASGSTLSGFTLTKGATRKAGDGVQEQSGGGVWCASISAVVSNCILGGNTAWAFGGGGYSGTLPELQAPGQRWYGRGRRG